jgi:hypothetical protein
VVHYFPCPNARKIARDEGMWQEVIDYVPVGERFGRWTVVRFHEVRKQKSRWWCVCDCGTEKDVDRNNLTQGISKSCGCLRAEIQARPRAPATVACGHCGKEIATTESRAKKTHYCSAECRKIGMKAKLSMENNPAWIGGKQVHPQGYILVRHGGRYVLEHRLVMARHLGRELATEEHVHHKNEDKADNRIENLEMTNASDHRHLHPLKTWSKHGHEACVECGRTESRHVTRGLCTRCYDRERFRLHGRRGRKAKATPD